MSIIDSPDFHHVPMVSFALYAPVKNKTALHVMTEEIIAVLTVVKKNGTMGMMLPIMLAANTMSALENAVVSGADMWSSSVIMVMTHLRLEEEMRSTTLARSLPRSPFFAKICLSSARSSFGCLLISWSSFCSRLW